MTFRFIHTADFHLDRPYPRLGSRRIIRRRELLASLEKVVDLCIAEQVDALLIAGDLFDSSRAESGDWVRGQLARLGAIPAFILPGNHDPVFRTAIWEEPWPENVHIFRGQEPETVIPQPRVSITAIPYREQDRHRRPLAGFVPPGAEGIRIGMIHGQLRVHGKIGEDYNPIDPDDIARSGFAYVALGHYHSLMDCSCGSVKAFYPGSPCRLDFSDTADRQVLLVTCGERVEVSPILMPDRPFLLVEEAADAAGELYRRLTTLPEEAFVKVRLHGSVTEPVGPLLDDIMEKFGDRFFCLEAEDQTMLTPAAEEGDPTVLGVFRRRMAERLATAHSEEERILLIKALGYGLTALRGGKIL